MRYEIYETRARFSYRAVLITLTSHLVVIDFRQGRISTAENRWDEKAGLQRDALISQVIDAQLARLPYSGLEHPLAQCY
jgi:hypothetical protein